MSTRNGKIARLPRAVRTELNQRLQNNEFGGPLLDWLNGLPAVKEILARHFGGVAINKQNLSEWRTGGFAEWEARQELLTSAGELAADAEEIKTATKGKLADHLGTVLTARYAALVGEWNGEVTEGFQKKLKVLRGMCQDIVQLRKADHSGMKLEIIENEQERERQKSVGEILEFFQEWLKLPAVCALACDNLKTAEQKEREWQELFAWATSPAARGEVKPGQGQTSTNIQAPSASEAPKATKIEDDPPTSDFRLRPGYDGQVGATREENGVESNPVKPGQSTGGRPSASAALRRDKQGESANIQTTSASERPTEPEVEDEDEDEDDGKQPNEVELSEIELENATWRKQHGF